MATGPQAPTLCPCLSWGLRLWLCPQTRPLPCAADARALCSWVLVTSLGCDLRGLPACPDLCCLGPRTPCASARPSPCRIQLPFSQSGVLIEQSNSNLKVVAKLGLVFMWNQDDSLLVRPGAGGREWGLGAGLGSWEWGAGGWG